MGGTITQEDRDFVETWEHISAQRWGITRLDARGEPRTELVVGNRTFMLTSAERMITQDRIKEEKNDPFRNGSFRPVIVPDSVTIKTNPNALSDEEILDILNTESEMAWQENLAMVDSVATIRRMMDMADDSDVTVKRFRQLEARLEEVRGIMRIEYDDPELQKFLTPTRGGSANLKGDAPPEDTKKRRGGGGRSRDYRREE